MDVFPLSDLAPHGYSSDFDRRTHHGVDIFAPEGTPVVAVSRGTARAREDPKGGLVVYLRADSGELYYYAHLRDWAMPPLQPDAPVLVDAGAVLGHVGTTGNARGTSPHLHFEMRVPGSGVVDPYHSLREVDKRGPDADLPDLGVRALPSVATPSPRVRASSSGTGRALLLFGVAWFLSRRR